MHVHFGADVALGSGHRAARNGHNARSWRANGASGRRTVNELRVLKIGEFDRFRACRRPEYAIGATFEYESLQTGCTAVWRS